MSGNSNQWPTPTQRLFFGQYLPPIPSSNQSVQALPLQSDVTNSSNLPRNCPMPTTIPFESQWYDEADGITKTLKVHRWEQVPTLDEIADMDPYTYYWSLLVWIFRRDEEKFLRFLDLDRQPQIFGWKPTFDAFKSNEVKESGKPSEDLVMPSGTVDSRLGTLSHWPTFNTASNKLKNGEVLDDKNCCMRIIFRKFIDHTALLHLDLYSRRLDVLQNRSIPPMNSWSELLRQIHVSFSLSLIRQARPKIWIINGRQTLSSFRRYFPMPHQFKWKKFAFFSETAQEPMDVLVLLNDRQEFEQVFFPGLHMEALLHPDRSRQKGRRFDDNYNLAAVMAGVPVNFKYGEAFYYIRCGQKMMTTELRTTSVSRPILIPRSTNVTATISSHATSQNIQAAVRDSVKETELAIKRRGGHIFTDLHRLEVENDTVFDWDHFPQWVLVWANKEGLIDSAGKVTNKMKDLGWEELTLAQRLHRYVSSTGGQTSTANQPSAKMSSMSSSATTKRHTLGPYAHLAKQPKDDEPTSLAVKCRGCGAIRRDDHPTYYQGKYVVRELECKAPDGTRRHGRPHDPVETRDTVSFKVIKTIAAKETKAKKRGANEQAGTEVTVRDGKIPRRQ